MGPLWAAPKMFVVRLWPPAPSVSRMGHRSKQTERLKQRGAAVDGVVAHRRRSNAESSVSSKPVMPGRTSTAVTAEDAKPNHHTVQTTRQSPTSEACGQGDVRNLSGAHDDRAVDSIEGERPVPHCKESCPWESKGFPSVYVQDNLHSALRRTRRT
jgi:hypothetical protein